MPAEARVVVPTHRYVRVEGNRIVPCHPLPFLLHVTQNGAVVPVHIAEMHELVVCQAVKAKKRQDFLGEQLSLSVHAGQIGNPFPPAGQLQLQPRMSSPDGLRAEPVQCLVRLLNAAKPRDQIIHIVDHENGTSADPVVIGAGEIPLDDAPCDRFKSGTIYLPQPYRAVLPPDAVGQAGVPRVVGVVVRPHEVKLHALVVCGAQKALVQALLKERTPVIPVPIVDKNIDSVGDCGVDLHFHYARVGFVYGSPQRLAVPDVFRRLERGVLRRTQHGLPLTHSLRPENRRTALTACVSRPYVGGYIVLHSIFPPLFCV